MPPRFKPYLALPLWIAVYLCVAGYIGEITRHQIPVWYRGLAKPPLNPPDIVFPVVWTLLYIMIAIAGWRLWQKRKEASGARNMTIFAIQTFINWAWSFLFFYYHLLGFSFTWILLLIVFVAWLMMRSDRITKGLLTPYLLWIGFAAYLNGMIWYLN